VAKFDTRTVYGSHSGMSDPEEKNKTIHGNRKFISKIAILRGAVT